MEVQVVELEEEEHSIVFGLQVVVATMLNIISLEAVEEE
jgi:hypothetical protein